MKRDEIEQLIPHSGPMCLLQEAVSWDDAAIECRAANHGAPDHPLRRDGRLDAVHLVEYAAQAAALHTRLTGEHGAGGAGVLVEVRDLDLAVEALDDVGAALRIVASAELRSGQGLIYRFRAASDTGELASGRLTIATR